MEFVDSQYVEIGISFSDDKYESFLEEKNKLFYNYDETFNEIFSQVFNFSVDTRKQIRLSAGLMAYNSETEFDTNYVPTLSFGPTDFSICNQNLLINLPNPNFYSIDFYHETRQIVLDEISNRFNLALKQAHSLLNTLKTQELKENTQHIEEHQQKLTEVTNNLIKKSIV